MALLPEDGISCLSLPRPPSPGSLSLRFLSPLSRLRTGGRGGDLGGRGLRSRGKRSRIQRVTSVLRRARCYAFRLRALQQRKEATHVVEFEGTFKVFDDLLPWVSRVVAFAWKDGAKEEDEAEDD
ncbi:hypothetical protein ABZP36_012788 [Zizania latifolia]